MYNLFEINCRRNDSLAIFCLETLQNIIVVVVRAWLLSDWIYIKLIFWPDVASTSIMGRSEDYIPEFSCTFSQCSFNNNTYCSIGLFDRKIFDSSFQFSFDQAAIDILSCSASWKYFKLLKTSPQHLSSSSEFFLTPVVTEVVSLVQWTNLICYSIWHNLEMLGRRVDQHQLFTLHHLLTTNFTRHKLSSENQQSLERKHATNTLPAQHRNI